MKDEKLTELQKRLEERKAQRMKERQSAKLGTKRSSADNRTRSLINQKVLYRAMICALFVKCLALLTMTMVILW